MKRRTLLAGGTLAACGLQADAAATLADLLPKLKTSIVAIGTYSALASPRFGFRGTGFIVDDGRTVATAAHVLSDNPADAMVLQMPSAAGAAATGDGSGAAPMWRALTLHAVDRAHDLALLRFEGPAMPVLDLAADDAAREGDEVVLIGFPLGAALGFHPVTHRGGIASTPPIVLPTPTARQLDAAAVARLRQQQPFPILQLDATAYPGNSGGPLLAPDTGRVVGVVNMAFIKGSREQALSQPSGISYAIPVRWLRALLQRS